MRSLFGGVFPLFALYMFRGMGIKWASTVCGLFFSFLLFERGCLVAGWKLGDRKCG
jgi:hypothetical protein